jgi:DNA-binding SARP family transcriptional activator
LENEMQGLALELPAEYYLERDPDMLIVRRLDGSMVGAFSARGFAPEVVVRAIEAGTRGDPLAHPRLMPALAPFSSGCSVRVRLFGHFEVFCNDEVVPLGRSGKALSILKYLLAHRSHPVSQDHLMGWLWPHSSLKKARWSLNSAIHSLRKLLSDCPHLANCPRHLLLEDGRYRLSPDIRVETDVEEFDACFEQGRHLEREGHTREAALEYEKAIDLYRGDYLIEDLYEDWTMVERERLSNAYVFMLSRLAVHYMESGQLQESVRACYRVLKKDSCHEESYRMLMRCYVQMGLRERALCQYRVYTQILKRQYGMDPSPETQSLYRDVAEGHTLTAVSKEAPCVL